MKQTPRNGSPRWTYNLADAAAIGRGAAIASLGGALAYFVNRILGMALDAEGIAALTVLCSVAVNTLRKLVSDRGSLIGRSR